MLYKNSILFSLLLTVSLLGIYETSNSQTDTAPPKDYFILKLHIIADIQADGSVRISEDRTFAFDGNFTWVEWNMPKKGFSEILDIEVFDNNLPMRLSRSGEVGTWELKDRNNRVEVRWNIDTKTEKRNLKIDYTITDALAVDEDWTEFFWTFIGNGWDKSTSDILIEIRLPEGLNSEEIFVWSRNNLENETTTIRNGTIIYRTERLSKKRTLALRTVFPSRVHSLEANSDQSINPFTIQAEYDRIDEETARKEAFYESIAPIAKSAGILLIILSLSVTIYIVQRFGRNGSPGILPPSWMEYPPTEDKPAIIGWLMNYRQVSGMQLAATILDLSRRGYFKVKQEKKDKKSFFSQTTEEYKLELTGNTPDKLNEWEQDLYTFLSVKIENGAVSLDSVFKDTPADLEWVTKWFAKVKKDARQKDWFVIQPKIILVQVFTQLAFLVAGIALLIWTNVIAIGVMLIATTAFGFLACAFLTPRTVSGQEVFLKWKAYKSALKHNRVSNKPELKSLHFIYAVTLNVTGNKFSNLVSGLNFHENDITWLYFIPGTTLNPVAFNGAIQGIVSSTTTSVNAVSGGGGASAGAAGGGGGGGAG